MTDNGITIGVTAARRLVARNLAAKGTHNNELRVETKALAMPSILGGLHLDGFVGLGTIGENGASHGPVANAAALFGDTIVRLDWNIGYKAFAARLATHLVTSIDLGLGAQHLWDHEHDQSSSFLVPQITTRFDLAINDTSSLSLALHHQLPVYEDQDGEKQVAYRMRVTAGIRFGFGRNNGIRSRKEIEEETTNSINNTDDNLSLARTFLKRHWQKNPDFKTYNDILTWILNDALPKDSKLTKELPNRFLGSLLYTSKQATDFGSNLDKIRISRIERESYVVLGNIFGATLSKLNPIVEDLSLETTRIKEQIDKFDHEAAGNTMSDFKNRLNKIAFSIKLAEEVLSSLVEKPAYYHDKPGVGEWKRKLGTFKKSLQILRAREKSLENQLGELIKNI